jgi:hypothetical protein
LEDETKVRYQELIKERMKQLKLIQL